MNLTHLTDARASKARLEKEREGEVIRREPALREGSEQGPKLWEQALLGEDPYDGVEGEDVGALQMFENSERDVRWVLADETGRHQIVLLGVEPEDPAVDLKEMRAGNAALQESGKIGSTHESSFCCCCCRVK
ncbi:hypothetical protein ACJRO7_027411 [Eucalyptus globulus]|uniref:Uncharacterized protein n=1 Tax=Eucalyptus globulus TaxID=34317 RepID=A0ABD3JRY5_EUCGL